MLILWSQAGLSGLWHQMHDFLACDVHSTEKRRLQFSHTVLIAYNYYFYLLDCFNLLLLFFLESLYVAGLMIWMSPCHANTQVSLKRWLQAPDAGWKALRLRGQPWPQGLRGAYLAVNCHVFHALQQRPCSFSGRCGCCYLRLLLPPSLTMLSLGLAGLSGCNTTWGGQVHAAAGIALSQQNQPPNWSLHALPASFWLLPL